jgi:hypothetical protein
VVEFTDPEMANAIIYAGMAWDGQIHTCQLYDRACRVKQCFRCNNYGHIGTQCDAAQTCGYCAELHETKHCKQKGVEGFTPRCPVCKDAHTAWSNACPARRKEMGRVEQAKQARNVYWPVAPRDEPHENNNPRKRTRHAHDPIFDQIITIGTPSEEPQDHAPVTQEPTQTQKRSCIQEQRTLQETMAAQAHPDLAAGGCIASAPRREPTPQQPATEQSQETGLAADDVPSADTVEAALAEIASTQQPLYSVEPLLEEFDFDTTDADEWLANLDNNAAEEGPHDAGTVGSVPTSMATNTRTAQGNIYKACHCPGHQEIYNNWPTREAELRIAHCMRICMYCGKDFALAALLRRHVRRGKGYSSRNLTVRFESGKHDALTPEWTPRPSRTRVSRSRSPTRLRTRETRSQSLIDSPCRFQRHKGPR